MVDFCKRPGDDEEYLSDVEVEELAVRWTEECPYSFLLMGRVLFYLDRSASDFPRWPIDMEMKSIRLIGDSGEVRDAITMMLDGRFGMDVDILLSDDSCRVKKTVLVSLLYRKGLIEPFDAYLIFRDMSAESISDLMVDIVEVQLILGPSLAIGMFSALAELHVNGCVDIGGWSEFRDSLRKPIEGQEYLHLFY